MHKAIQTSKQVEFKLNSVCRRQRTSLLTSRYSSNVTTKVTTKESLAKDNKRQIAQLQFEQPNSKYKRKPKPRLQFLSREATKAWANMNCVSVTTIEK